MSARKKRGLRFLKRSQFAGASNWNEKFGSCKGKHQSPININVLSVKKAKLPPLTFTNFHSQLKNFTLHNNGHTGLQTCAPFLITHQINYLRFSAMFTVDSNQSLEISGGPLKAPYKFTQFHFHWGKQSKFIFMN